MTRDRARHNLSWVDREITRILKLDTQGELAAFAVEERQAVRVEWADVVDRYLAVVAVYEAGALAPELDGALLDVSRRLGLLMPTLERMRLH